MGRAQFDQSPVAPKFRFRVAAEQGDIPIRLKIEINTRETDAQDSPLVLPLQVENPWFSGETLIPTFSREEMLATKLRALLQRDKARDLFDLDHALRTFDNLNVGRTLEIFGAYMELSGQVITRAQAQQRMLAKLVNRRFLIDIRPLLSADQAEQIDEQFAADAFRHVFTRLIDHFPGEPWARAGEMKERFGLGW